MARCSRIASRLLGGVDAAQGGGVMNSSVVRPHEKACYYSPASCNSAVILLMSLGVTVIEV